MGFSDACGKAACAHTCFRCKTINFILLGTSCEYISGPLGAPRSILELLRGSWGHLGRLRAVLGRPWGDFWGLEADLGASWEIVDVLGGLLPHLGRPRTYEIFVEEASNDASARLGQGARTLAKVRVVARYLGVGRSISGRLLAPSWGRIGP